MTEQSVLITGGAGYVGSVLTPKLLNMGWKVRVIDAFFYDENALGALRSNPGLDIVKADIRDKKAAQKALEGIKAVIHLACISNDPSSDLDPKATREINYDAFLQLMELIQQSGVNRLINASTSSVYGVKEMLDVVEEEPLAPMTLYARLKAEIEPVVAKANSDKLTTVSIRSATVCGYSPRMRLDLSVNILTAHAFYKKAITVFGGSQKRPNIHIEDITDLYGRLLTAPASVIGGKVFNAGAQNHTIMEIAQIVQEVLGGSIPIVVTSTNDLRSYHICSEKIKRELGFVPQRTIRDAVKDLKHAFESGLVPGAMEDIRYHNVKVLKEKFHALKN